MRIIAFIGVAVPALAACATQPNPANAQLVNAKGEPCEKASNTSAILLGDGSGYYLNSENACLRKLDWKLLRQASDENRRKSAVWRQTPESATRASLEPAPGE